MKFSLYVKRESNFHIYLQSTEVGILLSGLLHGLRTVLGPSKHRTTAVLASSFRDGPLSRLLQEDLSLWWGMDEGGNRSHCGDQISGKENSVECCKLELSRLLKIKL